MAQWHGSDRVYHVSEGGYTVEAAWCGCHESPGFLSYNLLWHTPWVSGAVPQALTLLGGARFIAWGPRHSLSRRACLGYGLAPGIHIKKPCVILACFMGCKQIPPTAGTAIRGIRHASHFGQYQRPLTHYQPIWQSTHHTIKSPTFPPQDLHRSEPTDPRYTQCQGIPEKLTAIHLYIWWKKRTCIFSNLPTAIYLKINEIKSNPLVRCLLQLYACQ